MLRQSLLVVLSLALTLCACSRDAGAPSNAKLTQAARDRLNAVVPDLVRSSAVRQQLFAQGWQAVGSSSDGLRSRLQEEGAAMQRIIATQGIRTE